MRHTDFLLDYSEFRRKTESLMEAADQGNYQAVFDEASKIVSNIPWGNWILEDLGTTLENFPPNFGIISAQTGFSFLVILSQLLEHSPIPSPGKGNIARIGAALGWNENDVILLSQGMAQTSLLKPNLTTNLVERPPANDPRWNDPAFYYWWVRPAYSYDVGWWDIERLEFLIDKLAGIHNQLEDIDIEKLNLHPSVTRVRLWENYYDTAELFKLAVSSGRGLFSITV